MSLAGMKNRIGDWLTGRKWPQVERDVRRFLRTWNFSVSEPGLVYARAEIKRMTPAALDMLLSRLTVISDEMFPRMVALDMSAATIARRHRVVMQAAMGRYASHINAHLVSEWRVDASRNYSLIWR